MAAGPDDRLEALCVADTTLRVAVLGPSAAGWHEIQALRVPIEFGSSNP